MIRILKKDDLNHEIQEYLLPITSSQNKVTILPSLTESLLGENEKIYNVIKIMDNLYITSHSLIINVDSSKLEFESLKYDEKKAYYVDSDNKDFINLTKKNLEKMCQDIVNRLDLMDTKIEKIDITTSGDLKNDVVGLKYLEEYKKGTFDKKTYQEINIEMDILDTKFMQIENEFKEKEFINKMEGKKKPEEEL
jgi:hypothetical protein